MQSSENLSRLMCMFPAKVEQGDTLPFNFSSNTVNTCPFHGIFAANFLHFCWWFYCLKMNSSEELSSVSKHRKTLDNPSERMSQRKCQISFIQLCCSVANHEFNVNESTYIK